MTEIEDRLLGLAGIKDGYAFAIKSENSKNNKSVSFKYGLLSRGIKAIAKYLKTEGFNVL